MRIWPAIILIITIICSTSAQSKYEQDFLEFWTDYKNNYAYFEKQGLDWNKVKEIYQPEAAAVKSDYEFIKLLERVVTEFHNGHVSLNTSYPDSNRIIPSGTDVFIEKSGDNFIITDVKPGSGAQACGLKPGMQVIKFNGLPVPDQLKVFLPKHTTTHNAAMYTYAVNMLLAGTHDKKREITVLEDGVEKTFYPDTTAPKADEKLLEYKILTGNVGYIKINNCLWNNDLIKEFDTALDNLLNTKSLIVDITDTPSGGNTTVARAIMGRFISRPLPYQKHVIEEKQYGTVRSWVEYVTPRKNVYKNKLILMVGHWTGSMGEGIAIGLDSMKRAKITGTKMAGLLGAIYTYRTTNTNIGYQIPSEAMYHVNGTPREDFIPPSLTANSTETFATALKLAGVK